MHRLSISKVPSTLASSNLSIKFLYRKSNYSSTEISIRIWGAKDPIPTGPTPDANSQNSEPKQHSNPVGALRQSKRIRQGKERASRKRMTITKETTVKDIKLFVRYFILLEQVLLY